MKINSLSRFLATAIALCALSAATTQAQVLLQENFTTAGALTSNGWTQIGTTTTNALSSAAPALEYLNLPSSGVGNAATLVNTGEDAYRPFGTTETGTIYTSALINVSAALAGDYFYAFYNQATTGGGYNGRVFIRSNGSGGFNFGVAKNTATAASVSYETTARSFNTTYLVVMKLTRNAGSTTDDVASLWINPALGVSEPAPDLTNTTGNDNTIGFTSVALRQGGSTDSPSLRLGNILVGTTWASVTPSTSSTAPIINSFSPLSGEVGSTVVITGIRLGPAPAVRFNGIVAASSVNPEGTEIIATVPSGATTGPITVELAGEPTATSSVNFTVIDPLAPTLSTSGTLTAFNTLVGTPSASQSFTVSGANLTGSVTVTAPTGFEVSSDNVTFAATATLPTVGGVLNGVPAYVRISAAAPVGAVAGNVGVSATGVTTRNVAASGSVSPVATFVNLLNTNPGSYTQNFDSLGTTSVSNVISGVNGVQTSLGSVVASTLDGWYAAKIGGTGTAATSIVANNGSSSSGGVFNYGSTNAPSNSDRSLGALASGTVVAGFGALIKNETGQTLQSVQISFTAKFWRSSTATNNVLTFGYGSVDGTAVTTGNFLTTTNAAALGAANIVGPAPVATAGPLDGNDPANQSAVSNLSIPVTLAPGATLFIRWQDANEAGNDAGLAIDNVSFTAVASGGSGGYTDWAAGFGLDPAVTTGPTAGAPTADPDGDNFNNRQEYAFGTNPTQGTGALLGTSSSGGNLTVTWLQRGDVTYTPQSTANLATTPFADDFSVTVVNGPSEPTPPAGYIRRQFSVPSTGNNFYRVKATTTAP